MTYVRESVDVAIVGAGPVGLTTALALSQEGLRVAVYERLPEPSVEWRASTFHPPTLEIALELGVAGEMLRQGLIAPRSQFRDRVAGVIAEFDLSLISSETPYPFRLQLEQYKYVDILQRRLTATAPTTTIHYGHEVVGFQQTDDGVEVHTQGGPPVKAAYLVGADGARSTVRKALGIPFEGSTYQHRYLVLSLDYPLDHLLPDICDVNYVADPEEHLLLLRIPDLWRVILSVAPEISDETATSPEYIRERLRLIVGDEVDLPVCEAKIYAVHQRVAQTFRVGRVLLAGDAAHINSPMGGMGLNSGIHDAYDLSVQLGAVLGKGADPTCLDEWAQRRRAVAVEEIRRLTHETTTALAESNVDERLRYQRRMAAIAADPERARQWMLDSSMISNVRRHRLPERAASRRALG